VTAIAGVPVVPLGRACACWKEDAEASLIGVAPLRYGRRSVPGGEVPRRWTRPPGAAMLHCVIEQGELAMR
jgi:hypothetical protein